MIRHLNGADIDPAAAVLATAGGHWLRLAFGRDAAAGLGDLLRSGLGQAGVTTLVAVHAGDVVGVVRLIAFTPAGYSPPPTTSARARRTQTLLGRSVLRPGEGYVESMAVIPSARGAGIGRELLAASMAAARDAGATDLTCWVHRRNVAALRLCAEIGLERDASAFRSAPIASLLGMRPLRRSLPDIRPSG